MIHQSTRTQAHKIGLLLLLAGYLFGLGHIAIMPPFEGFDETAHLSRVIEEAHGSGTEPAQKITQSVYDYALYGPMPVGWIFNGDMHAGDPLYKGPHHAHEQFLAYPKFFADAEKVKFYQSAYEEQAFPRAYQASPQQNWQYQHPRLFYYGMAALTAFIPPLPLAGLFLVLRFLCFSMGFGGLVIGLLATRRHLALTGHRAPDSVFVFMAAYPFLLPSFYADMARLGNDSLCLLLIGIAWALLLSLLRNVHHLAACLGIGAAFGLCLATKTLTLPFVAASLLVLLIYFILHPAAKGKPLLLCLKPAFVIGAAFALVIAGLSYAGFWQEVQISPPDSLHAGGPQPLETGIGAQFFSLCARGLGFMLISIPYLFNTWSLTIADYWLVAVCALFAVIILAHYAVLLRRRADWLTWLPTLLAGTLFAGLCYFMMRTSLNSSNPYIGGYYLHIAAPAIALALGLGLQEIAQRRYGVLFFRLLLPWLGFVHLPIIACHVGLFTGMTAPTQPFSTAHFIMSLSWPVFWDRLALLAYPSLAVACFGAGLLALGAGLWGLGRLTGARTGLAKPD